MSKLQLEGRAAPALASLTHGGRVLHVSTFSKNISPALRLGFVVVPLELACRFSDLAACLGPAPAATIQQVVAAFLHEGHYLRHMKRFYAARRAPLLCCLQEGAFDSIKVQATAGMAVVTEPPKSASDVDIAMCALRFGLAPVPLSPLAHAVSADCRRLAELARQY